MPFTGEDDSYDISTTNDEVHARIYFIKGGFSQARIIFKTEEADNPTINVNVIKRSNAVENNQQINEATFDVKIENVNSIKGHSNANNGTIIMKNVSAGTINLQEIQGNGGNSNIKITFTETQAPDNYKIKDAVTTVEIKQDCSQYRVNGGSWQNTSSGSTINLSIHNTPLITLGGTVWEDGQKGEKNAVVPDGENNDGTFVDGVKVYLYNDNGTYTGRSTTTQNGGKYSFNDVEKTNDGYYVVFEYNGIKYQETNGLRNATGGDSKASETSKDRTDFNNRFTTITAGQSNDATPLRYDYDNGKSTLQGINNNDGTNPNAGTTNKHFKIQAKTTTRKNTDKNINCGLVEKELDLGTVMQVDSTTLKINDKTTKYNYGKSLAENLQDLQVGDLDRGVNGLLNELASDSSIRTTYLETSDYYYRIEDYKGSNDEIKNEDATDIYNAADKLKELRVFVTYKVDLINQTINNGVTVNELAYYYYDKNYTLVGIGKTIDGTTGQAINDTSLTRTPISDAFGKSAIKVSNINATSSDKSVIQSLYFTFEVNKTNNSLPQAITNPEGLNCANIVEITSYSTNKSLVDSDSAPGNVVGIDGKPRYEDDTSQSNGLKIVLKGTDRTIKGTVFEDTNKDGILDNNDTKVDHVIVQLIEIRPKASGGLGEYIWQQTVSGSNKVKMTTKNGYEEVEYTNSVQAESGEYEFKGFIPGNYIIRYIYGDGTTYDFDQDGKIAKYNGQDYKSTKDPKYNKEVAEAGSIREALYNEVMYDENKSKEVNEAEGRYKEGSSVARDNEARRLEVMAYSTMIDNKIGEALDVLDKDISRLSETERNILNEYYDSLDKNNSEVKYALALLKKFTNQSDITFDNISDENKYNLIKYYVSNKTWMAAETSRINVPIDSTTTSIDSNSTTVGLDYKDNKVTFENMNFGLALRPQTNIVLEKHITGLKITPNGTGVQSIVDAKADIESIVNGDAVSTQGVTQGLAAIKSTRGNRGFWQVATDVEELAQGAELEVEYTYVVRNDSEADYLSTDLVEKYVDGVENGQYKDFLVAKSNELRNNTKGHTNSYGTYLGDFYYTGNVPAERDTNQTAVLSRVEAKGLEEALNNDLTFDTTEEKTSGEDFVKINESAVDKNKYKENSDVSTEKIQTVIRNNTETEFLASNEKDYSKTVTLRTVLSSSTGGELGANIPSYIAEVVKYSNAAGRSDMTAEPENLSYVHSDDKDMTMDSVTYEKDGEVKEAKSMKDVPEGAKIIREANQHDEFWGESIIITKPTGEDKITPIQIAIITVGSMAVLGAGIVLIKKFVLKK